MGWFEVWYMGLLKLVRKITTPTEKIRLKTKRDIIDIQDLPPKLLLLEMDVFSVLITDLDKAMISDTQRINIIGTSNEPPIEWDIIFFHIDQFAILWEKIKDAFQTQLENENENEKEIRKLIYELGQILKVIEESFRRLWYL